MKAYENKIWIRTKTFELDKEDVEAILEAHFHIQGNNNKFTCGTTEDSLTIVSSSTYQDKGGS